MPLNVQFVPKPVSSRTLEKVLEALQLSQAEWNATANGGPRRLRSIGLHLSG